VDGLTSSIPISMMISAPPWRILRSKKISISRSMRSNQRFSPGRPKSHWNSRLSRSSKRLMGKSSPMGFAHDRSLNRAALAGASLAKERRDLKRLEANEQADSESRDISQPWLDPMANQQERQFASDVKGNLMGQKATQMPAWKSANKVTSYGKITSLSIQDQRKSLPIYKLREQLVQAIRDVSLPLRKRLTVESNPRCRWRYRFWQNHANDAIHG
jgi:hypothetical protein